MSSDPNKVAFARELADNRAVMCGIAGIVDFEGRPVQADTLDHACRMLSHRGPDDRGTWSANGPGLSIGLASTRLSVIGPGPEGAQPMVDSAKRHVVVFNGEIYNYRQLREELAGSAWPFKTATDTEVLLAALATWSQAALDRLNGMWAFCFYDVHNQRGWLCRDRFGIKPLYYSLFEDRLAFASEMATLTAISNAPHEIDSGSLGHYLRYGYVGHPHTIYRRFRKLPPGHLLCFDAAGARTAQRYYQLKVKSAASEMTYSDACMELKTRLAGSVAARTNADVGLGAFLSGGIDSSVIVHDLVGASSKTVQTFSIGYKDQPRYDESRYAKRVAEALSTDHHELLLGFDDVLDHLPKLLDHMGEPFGDASLIPTSLLSAHARKTVTVALSGDGGDELFAGYQRYLGHHYLRRFLKYPRVIRGLARVIAGVLPSAKTTSLGDRVRQARKLLRTASPDPLERHLMWSQILAPEAAELLDPNGLLFGSVDPAALPAEVLGELNRFGSDDAMNQILLLDLLYQLPADMLHKVDLASMVHSLEVRVPMLDPSVVEFVVSLPSTFKIEGTNTKRLLRDAYRDKLPAEVLSRPKMGFELPIGEFLRNELRDMFLSTVTRDVIDQLPPLSFNGVMRIYDDHCQKRAEHADILYALLVLCWWRTRRS